MRPTALSAFPTLYLYLFAAWTLLIVLVALVIESSDADEEPCRDRRAAAGGPEVTHDRTGA